MRSRKHESSTYIKWGLTLGPEHLEKLRRVAKQLNLTQSAVVREIIEKAEVRPVVRDTLVVSKLEVSE